jgi:SAM-dependent methyltransferase
MNKLSLSHRLPQAIALTTGPDSVMCDCGEARPRFPFDDASFDRVEAIDAIEHVMDEEAWLAECARVLRPGGTLVLQVPYAGWTSWWEHLNIARYAADVLGIGENPQETQPVGWHRQYRTADVTAMVDQLSLRMDRIERHSLGLAELPALTHLLVGTGLRHDPSTPGRVKERRASLERRDAAIPAGPISRRIRVTARKP